MFLLPHLGTIIWTTLIFLLLLFILGKYAWKPLLKALSDREQNVERALAGAAEARKKIDNLQNEQESIILKTKYEKERIIKEGTDQRDRIIAAAKEKAQEEADKIIAETRKQMMREKEAVMAEMKKQLATLSVEIASKVIKADMEDRTRHEKFVQELVSDIDLN